MIQSKETTLPRMIAEVAEKYPDNEAQGYRISEGHFEFVTYKDMADIAFNFASGLLARGVKRFDHIGLISDNRREWFQAAMGIMAIGAIDVPRGCDATENEIAFILECVECAVVVAENAQQVTKVLAHKARLPRLTTFITFDDIPPDVIARALDAGVTIVSFQDVVDQGKVYRDAHPGAFESELAKGQGDHLACIIFT